MDFKLGSRFRSAWNAFTGADKLRYRDLGPSYSYRNDRPRLIRGSERSIINSIFNRIAMDVASLEIQHVKLDDKGRFSDVINSDLNNCLTLEANIDQTARAYIQDLVYSMLQEGVIASAPIDTNDDLTETGSYRILTMRTGSISEWYPYAVKINAYNEATGKREDVIFPKSSVAIIENPLYAVVNEHNSTLQRLVRKLNLLDAVDEQSGSGKLDMIIQVPYTIRSEVNKTRAEERKRSIEQQLAGSKYGIAYIDSTEHITQLNRPLNNNLMSQVEYLTNMLYSQLGITQAIMDGTADEQAMLNYNSRTIEPIASAIVDEYKRKFLTKTARSQGQSIMVFRNPFKLVPLNNIAEIADKFTRNEILSANEIRQVIGYKPSDDPKADQLINSNLNHSNEELDISPSDPKTENSKGENQNG